MKTREDFLAAADEAYRVYEKFMYKTATDFFGIAEPTHEKVAAFHQQQPLAHTMTDFYLSQAGKIFTNLLTAGWEIYVDASDKQQEIIGGFFDLDGRWIAWAGEPTDLPQQIRLGDLTLDAEWSVLLRYVFSDTERAIAGVALHCWEPEGSREHHQSLYGQVSEAMGAPLALYAPTASPGLPDRLLWTGNTVDAELKCIEFPIDPDDGSQGYRSYKLTISRKTNEKPSFQLGCMAERLLK